MLHAGKDGGGGNALHWAASKGYAHIVENLLHAGADATRQSSDGATALYRAAAAGHDVVIDILLRNGVNPKVKANDGGTALQRAAWRGHLSIAKKLLQAGSDATVVNNDGWTALHFSAYAGHYDIAELLNQHPGTAYQEDSSTGNMDTMGLFEHLIRLHPRDCTLQRALGNEFLRRKMYVEAKSAFDKSVLVAIEDLEIGSITDLMHHGIRCDDCAQVLRGKCYKCTHCPWNYDACERCFAAHLHRAQDAIMIPSEAFRPPGNAMQK